MKLFLTDIKNIVLLNIKATTHVIRDAKFKFIT